MDEKTKTAVKEFISVCQHNKLIDFFKDDPYNTVIIIDGINATNPLWGIGGTTLYRIWRNHTKDIQCLIWLAGIKFYLKPKHCDTAAELLVHSLQRFPNSVTFQDDSEIISKLKASDKFRQQLKWDWLDKTAHRRSQASFSSKVELRLNSDDNLDLYYSFGKIDIYYSAVYDSIKGWIFDCSAEDTYDYDLDRKIPYEDIFTKGLVEMIKDNKGRLANNAGWFSQKEKVISPYEVSVRFKYYYKE